MCFEVVSDKWEVRSDVDEKKEWIKKQKIFPTISIIRLRKEYLFSKLELKYHYLYNREIKVLDYAILSSRL